VKVRAVRETSTGRDAALIERIKKGELDSLAVLYDLYAPDLIRFAARLCVKSEAEDVVQNVFIRVLKIAGSFDPEAPSARPWLFAIAVRVLHERNRSVRRLATALLRLGMESTERHSQPTVDGASDVARALERLASKKRAVLILAEVEGFSCAEIAAMLEVPIGTVWTRLHHARRELRVLLERSEP
jgi:RNA polymerase sigma-70 factor (ECF subfamily)